MFAYRLPRHDRLLLGVLCTLVFCVWQSAACGAEAGKLREVIPLLKRHCNKCHGDKPEPAGERNLAAIAKPADLLADLELMQDVVDVLETEAMPPETEPPLDGSTRKKLIEQLKESLKLEVARRNEFPAAPLRRMNRFQYNNAVQDLFELKVDVFALPERMLREHGNYFQPASGKMPPRLNAGSRPLGKSQLVGKRLAGVAPFPQDLRAEHGFDNRGDHLSLSPLLLESFFKLSRSIMESPDFGPRTCGVWSTFFAAPVGLSRPLAPAKLDSEIRARLRPFLRKAFRRPVEPDLLDRYANLVTRRMQAGDDFSQAMGMAASSAITSPKFLYIYEGASGKDSATQIDDFELASRLSFFLWGSIPDETLLDLAASGSLRKPLVLKQQLKRMLSDRKLKRFCDSFPAQWLQLERIIASVPDPKLFPEFYFGKYRVSMHMMMEPLLVFETLLIENRSILELVDSDFSYRSELLESWYQSGVKSKRVPPTSVPFRRVPISDRRQGGVITTAAVMTMTSGPIRTRPITRGAWLATVIFNDPPEPPPADVPPLPEADQDTSQLTLRERLARHRKQASCAGCHSQIDPLGFAFEHYGPTGLWRDKYENGRQVDAAGMLFRKHKFEDVVGFKDAILAEKERFARAFAEHLLSFALARSVSAADSPALDQIVRETVEADFRLQSMIEAVATSAPFLSKSTPKRRSPEKLGQAPSRRSLSPLANSSTDK